jgi:hypothetical protein
MQNKLVLVQGSHTGGATYLDDHFSIADAIAACTVVHN